MSLHYVSDQIISVAFSAVLKNDLLLHEAVIKNDAEAVEEVLKEPLDVNSRNNVSTHPPASAFV